MDVRFQTPFSLICAGPTGCGKTAWVRLFLKHAKELMNSPPDRVIWCYGQYQDLYSKQDWGCEVEFVEGLPETLLDEIDPRLTNLLILDDLMCELADDKRITKLATKYSHHKNISLIYILQNMFQQGRENRTVSLNSQYMLVFKNPRDRSQITHLGKQLYPRHVKFLQEAYEDATAPPFGYLLIDLKQNTPEDLRLRTNIFPENPQPPIAYVKRYEKMPTEAIREYEHHLRTLACKHCSGELRKAIVSDKNVLKCICEIALNMLKGKVPITSSKKRKLEKAKVALYKLASKKVKSSSKRKIIVQSGSGFLPALILPALTLLSSLI
jgi:hypothetical protein